MIGQALSHYQTLERLGEDGMGVVYRAATRLERFAATKSCRPSGGEPGA